MKQRLPTAVLLDLDDTILNDSGGVERCWTEACFAHKSELGDIDPAVLRLAIAKNQKWFWADPERHRAGRLDLHAARREIVRMSLVEIGDHHPALPGKIAEHYGHERDAAIQPLPQAIATVQWLRERGCRLALLTNGSTIAQRSKISRFGLTDLFDAILIEGEAGYGKPDPRIYAQALQALDVEAGDAWMVGDNLEWDVAQPQKMGVFAIWVDAQEAGLPEGSTVRPDRVVRALSELRTSMEPPMAAENTQSATEAHGKKR